MIISETWLDSNTLDAAIELAGRIVYRADCNSHSGKSRGGGLCIYICNRWCTDARIVETHCSTDIEYMILSCRPFYLPREVTSVLITAVYIPPQANAKLALDQLQGAINKCMTARPDSVVIAAGDFNHANLNTVMPKFFKNVTIPTRDKNTLDQVYTSIQNAYKVIPLPHLGLSDHLCLLSQYTDP